MNPLGFGARPRPIDERDYHIYLGTATPVPDSFASPVTIIYNQDKFGTCGAHAGAQYANVLFGTQTSPKFLWKVIKSFDGLPLDIGTDMRSIFQAMQKFGVCDYALMPNPDDYSTVTLEQYSNINEITVGQYMNAAEKKILSYSFINRPTIAQIKQAVYQYKAALLLVDIGDAWWVNGWQDSAVNPLKVGNQVGHHFILATEFGFTLIGGPNSWSQAWGKNGFFDFDGSYQPHVWEMGVAVANNVSPTPIKYLFTKDFGFMSLGTDVKELQKRLGVSQTGLFFVATRAAVQTYQKAHGIPATGYVGPLTRASLNA